MLQTVTEDDFNSVRLGGLVVLCKALYRAITTNTSQIIQFNNGPTVEAMVESGDIADLIEVEVACSARSLV
jgi:hypothetical protein